MEDSFRVRVDKVFGSLDSSSSFSTGTTHASAISSYSGRNLTSLWCLTDDEIERREWNRDKTFSDDDDDDDDDGSGPPILVSKLERLLADQPMRSSLQDDLQELLDHSEDDDDQKNHSESSVPRQLDKKPDDHNDEEWDIRSSVGLDSTLDLEEEEDAFDQVAIGKEVDAFYRKDITDYEADMDSSSELPKTFRDITKDPRANHIAAQIRLKEDADAARLHTECSFRFSSVMEDGRDLKSVLRKRGDQLVAKTDKHVTFEDVDKQYAGQSINLVMEESPASDAVSLHSQISSSIPDYVRNPSKYTHYTFDSLSDASEEANQKAYMDFLNLLRGTNTTETQDGNFRDLPKSVTFTPKKKLVDSFMDKETDSKDKGDGNRRYSHRKCVLRGIAVGDAQDSGSCAMEEDEPETAADKSSSLPKAGRRYRTRASISLDEIAS